MLKEKRCHFNQIASRGAFGLCFLHLGTLRLREPHPQDPSLWLAWFGLGSMATRGAHVGCSKKSSHGCSDDQAGMKLCQTMFWIYGNRLINTNPLNLQIFVSEFGRNTCYYQGVQFEPPS